MRSKVLAFATAVVIGTAAMTTGAFAGHGGGGGEADLVHEAQVGKTTTKHEIKTLTNLFAG